MSDLIPSIINGATAPKSVSIDGQTIVSQNVSEQIKADQYAKAAAANRGLPYRSVRLRPGNNAGVDHRCDDRF